ncbi:MAG: hypothetical protein LKM30_08135 [Bacilli bacterium]|jgi:hypothetical protein|nr:hypothetical protein [Bacilli bacterium]
MMKDRTERTNGLRSSRRLRKTCTFFSLVSLAIVSFLSGVLILFSQQNSEIASRLASQNNGIAVSQSINEKTGK